MALQFSASEISDYYSFHIPALKQARAGRWRGPCPLHGGTGDNFILDLAKGLWFCFTKCGRGGGLIDFEMSLNRTDFRTALVAINSLLGRPMPEQVRLTRDEREISLQARERQRQELSEAFFFADAATLVAEAVLEELDPCHDERTFETRLIEDMRRDARAVYRDWHRRWPIMTAALVNIGRRHDRRLQESLCGFVESVEGDQL